MSLELWCPLRLEAQAARRGAPGAGVVRTGMGPRRAAAFAGQRRRAPGGSGSSGAVVLGLAGALTDSLGPGEVIVADSVRGPGPARSVGGPGTETVWAALTEAGIGAVRGPIRSVARPVRGPSRRRGLAGDGSLAADMESWWLLGADPAPLAVVRVVSDTPAAELASLWLPLRVRRALAVISRIAATLHPREAPIQPDIRRGQQTAALGGIT
ncbi:MAG: hypothetical protein F4X37_04805 [Acidimicrobiia bacterium]|nr:hypothetical protein [Acidimicrobiia bacterium]